MAFQRLDVRGRGFLEELEVLEELEGLEALEKLEAQQRAMTELKRKRNNNDAVRARVCAHYRSFVFFAVTSVTQTP